MVPKFKFCHLLGNLHFSQFRGAEYEFDIDILKSNFKEN